MKTRILSVIIAVIIALCVNTASAQLSAGEFAVQANLGYMSKISSATGAVGFNYAITKGLRIAPEIGGVFRNKHQDAFTADFNFHFPFSFATSLAALYPLVGVNYTAWTHHVESSADDEFGGGDSCHRRLGLNAGAGFDLKVNSNIMLFAEAKYCIISDYASRQIAFGAAYIF